MRFGVSLQAYVNGLLPPKYMFITNAWYEERWWEKGFSSEHYNCTAEHLAAVALYSLASVFSEFPDEDSDIEAESNIVSINIFCIVHNSHFVNH